MNLSCAEFKDIVWDALDKRMEVLQEDPAAHAAGCQACRGYQERARQLDRFLEAAFRAEQANTPSVETRVLAHLRRERALPRLTSLWIPAGAFSSLAACWGLWRWDLWSPVSAYLTPDLSFLESLSSWTGTAASRSADFPTAALLGLCGLAAFLWSSVHHHLKREEEL